jgi:hypothetical protein
MESKSKSRWCRLTGLYVLASKACQQLVKHVSMKEDSRDGVQKQVEVLSVDRSITYLRIKASRSLN